MDAAERAVLAKEATTAAQRAVGALVVIAHSVIDRVGLDEAVVALHNKLDDMGVDRGGLLVAAAGALVRLAAIEDERTEHAVVR